jgi:hypothetical protein
LARDRRGNIYAATRGLTLPDSPVLQYDPGGKFVRSIGRKGIGPGEFSEISAMVIAPGDSLYVVGSRTHVLGGSAMSYVRSFRMPVVSFLQVLPRPNGLIIVNSVAAVRPEHAGSSIFSVSPDGRMIRAYPSVSFFTDPNGQPMRGRILGPGAGNTFWSTEPTNYVIERWTTDGVRTAWLYRDAHWFTPAVTSSAKDARLAKVGVRGVGPGHNVPPTVRRRAAGNEAPFGGLKGIWGVEQSDVWIAGLMPDENWSTARSEDSNALFDTIVEVLDPVSHVLRTSIRLPFAVHSVLEPGIISAVTNGAGGFIEVSIWQLTLDRSED